MSNQVNKKDDICDYPEMGLFNIGCLLRALLRPLGLVSEQKKIFFLLQVLCWRQAISNNYDKYINCIVWWLVVSAIQQEKVEQDRRYLKR